MAGESRYPGARPPVLENFRRAFSSRPNDRPWVSEDAHSREKQKQRAKLHLNLLFAHIRK